MIKITCSSCSKQLQIDETKLPMKEVKFPCPHCKVNQFFDRTKMAAAEAAVADSAPAPDGAAAAGDDDEDRYGLPGALIVGRELPGLREVAKSAGFAVQVYASAEDAKDVYYREYPHLVFLCPTQVTPPPLQDIQPMTSVSPVDRRKGFFVLVADNLRTLDGNAAFLYGVNMVLATKDIPSFKKVYRDAHSFHERLYQHFTHFSEGKT